MENQQTRGHYIAAQIKARSGLSEQDIATMIDGQIEGASLELLHSLEEITGMYALARSAQGWPDVDSMPIIVRARRAIANARALL